PAHWCRPGRAARAPRSRDGRDGLLCGRHAGSASPWCVSSWLRDELRAIQYDWRPGRNGARRLRSLSPFRGLGDSRILALSGKGISFERGGETVPAVAHGLWSRWFVVAIPSTEPCRDPGDEGERAWGVRIFLTQRFALELFRQTFESGGKVRVDHVT